MESFKISAPDVQTIAAYKVGNKIFETEIEAIDYSRRKKIYDKLYRSLDGELYTGSYLSEKHLELMVNALVDNREYYAEILSE